MRIMLSHGITYQIMQHHDSLLRKHLQLSGALFQVLPQKDACQRKNQRDQKNRQCGLGDIDTAKDRNREINIRAVYADIIHSFYHLTFGKILQRSIQDEQKPRAEPKKSNRTIRFFHKQTELQTKLHNESTWTFG